MPSGLYLGNGVVHNTLSQRNTLECFFLNFFPYALAKFGPVLNSTFFCIDPLTTFGPILFCF